jgi:hypothetical protein
MDNEIIAEDRTYSTGAFSRYSTPTVYCGGLVGYSENGQIKYSYAEGDSLNAVSAGSVYVGGLAGMTETMKVDQNYTKNEYITMEGYASGNKNTVSRRAAGFIGNDEKSVITSSFAYCNKQIVENNSPTNQGDTKVAGFIAGATSTTVNNCAVYIGDNMLQSAIVDVFCPDSLEANECYVTSSNQNNVCNCESVGDFFWSDGSMKSKLKLTSGYWKISTDELPYLDYSTDEE